MYINTNAIIRADITSVVEEASAADSYFIGTQVFPILPVEKVTGEYYKMTKVATELMKAGSTDRAPKGAYGQVDRTFVKDAYTCLDRGLEEFLDDTVTASLRNYFPLEVTSAKLLARAVRLGHEARIAGQVFNTGNFDTAEASVAYVKAATDTIDFAEDVQRAIKRVKQRGELVNAIVMNRDVYDRIRVSTKFAKFLFGNLGGGQQVTEQMLGKAFGIPNVLIADATVDGAKKGQSSVALSYVWSGDYFWVGNIQGGDYANGGAGRTLVWTGLEESNDFLVTETYRDEGHRSDVVRVRTHTAEKVINPAAGTLVTTGFVA